MQKKVFLIILILFFCAQSPAQCFIFQKKDYKDEFVQNALKAEKRKDKKSAFFSFEKGLFYYPNDEKLLNEYAKYCQRQQIYDKAATLYEKLYKLTNKDSYLFKANFAKIKSGNVDKNSLSQMLKSKKITQSQKNIINKELIFQYANDLKWNDVKKTCDRIPIKSIDKSIITTCIVGYEQSSKTKDRIKYYIRYSDLYPSDISIVNKIIALSEEYKIYNIEEKFLKRLSNLNPSDNGIKYKLAGFYEARKNYKKANQIYEELKKSGDLTPHVINSQKYVLSMLNPQKKIKQQYSENQTDKSKKYIIFGPKISQYKLDEAAFYEAWQNKDYDNALVYLEKLLNKNPKNIKLLKHKIDIFASLKKYNDALNIVNSLLNKKTNKEYLKWGRELALAGNAWEKAIFYNTELLKYNPNDEETLNLQGDLYAIQKDYKNAIIYFEKLVDLYPKPLYKYELAKLYLAENEFQNAEWILSKLYNSPDNNEKITEAYINSLLALEKLEEANEIIEKSNLSKTLIGYKIAGLLSLKNKDYEDAADKFFKAKKLDSNDLEIQNRLADSYRLLGFSNGPRKLYQAVLEKDISNEDAIVGLGYVSLEEKEYPIARKYFNKALNLYPNSNYAKTGLFYSYYANEDFMNALDTIDKFELNSNEMKFLKAEIYYRMGMHTNSKDVLKKVSGSDAEKLRLQIKKDEAFCFTPNYQLFTQQLATEFQLNYQRYGFSLSKKIDENSEIYADYKIFSYTSGNASHFTNVANEFRGGIISRPKPKFEYKADIGVKTFQFGTGDMLLTDSWLKYYINDKLNARLGIYRTNLEQTYLSAVGTMVGNNFTGRVADNCLYLELAYKLPHEFYTYVKGSYKLLTAQNLQTNQALEGLYGIGKLVYNNPKNKWIQKVNFDIVTYNTAYQYDLLNIYDNLGNLYGGYFSPSYFNGTTGNIRIEGKKKYARYGLTGFAGVQTSRTPNFTKFAWGVGPFLAFDITDHLTVNAMYQFYNYADVQRHYFTIFGTVRLYRKNGKKA